MCWAGIRRPSDARPDLDAGVRVARERPDVVGLGLRRDAGLRPGLVEREADGLGQGGRREGFGQIGDAARVDVAELV